MSLRLRHALAIALSVFGVLSTVVPARTAGLEVTYAPDVVFLEEPLTFQLQVPKGVEPEARLGNKELRTRGEGEGRELTLRPKAAGILRISAPDGEGWSFRLTRPDTPGRFTERDGFLEMEGTPVVLVPDHLDPPPLDRRWETVALVERAVRGEKAPLSRIRVFAAADSGLPEDLAALPFHLQVSHTAAAPDTWFRVHGVLCALERTPGAFVAVELDFYDLDRGMPYPVWWMKWQFVLQRIQEATEFEDGVLVGPDFSGERQRWAAVMREPLRNLARAHGLRYVDRSLPVDVRRARLVDQLKKEYVLP